MRLSRKTFLVDRKLQLEVVGYMLIIWMISSLSMVYLVDSTMSAAFETYALQPGLFQDTQLSALMELKSDIRSFGLVGIVIALIGSAVGGIFVSHRVAGPIYNLRRKMEKAVETGSLEHVHFRKADFGSHLADAYNKLVDKFSSKN